MARDYIQKAVADLKELDRMEAKVKVLTEQLNVKGKDKIDESLIESAGTYFKKIHDEDEYLWNLHNCDYQFIYDKLKAYGDIENEGIEKLFDKMPEEEQKNLLYELVSKYGLPNTKDYIRGVDDFIDEGILTTMDRIGTNVANKIKDAPNKINTAVTNQAKKTLQNLDDEDKETVLKWAGKIDDTIDGAKQAASNAKQSISNVVNGVKTDTGNVVGKALQNPKVVNGLKGFNSFMNDENSVKQANKLIQNFRQFGKPRYSQFSIKTNDERMTDNSAKGLRMKERAWYQEKIKPYMDKGQVPPAQNKKRWDELSAAADRAEGIL